jgi:DNA-binding beta-propeller fold protein YncE
VTRRIAAFAALLALPASLVVTGAASAVPAKKPEPAPPVFTFLSRFANGGSEVSAVWDESLYVIGDGATLDIVDIADPASPELDDTVDLTAYGSGITSVATSRRNVAVAIPAAHKTDPGTVVLLDHEGNVLASTPVGANPDMLVFDEKGNRLVIANEGEPVSYTPKDDAEGSVTIIEVDRLIRGKKNAIATAVFTDFNVGGSRHAELPADVRIFGPGATVAEDLEPEYVTIHDRDTAYVTLQENNAIAEIDLDTARVVDITPLALKDQSVAGFGLDPSDRDGAGNGPAIKIGTWPVFGVPMPDGIASFALGGEVYLITANEGDARADWPGYAEELRIGNAAYRLDADVFPNATTLKQNANLGRLNATIASGDTDGDGFYERIEVFGTRSATIWTADGERVWDSGDTIERAVATALPANFNASNDNSALDDRSDNKGPEPEGVTVGEIGERLYAFVGLERVGGFVVFDVTDPHAPVFVQYANSRDFAVAATSPTNDSGPEVLTFVGAKDSPTGRPLVLVSNEISHTVSIWSVN